MKKLIAAVTLLGWPAIVALKWWLAYSNAWCVDGFANCIDGRTHYYLDEIVINGLIVELALVIVTLIVFAILMKRDGVSGSFNSLLEWLEG